MEKDEIIITFYFVSGLSMDVSYKKEAFEEVINILKKNWPTTNSIGPKWGINFALVTHYEVKE